MFTEPELNNYIILISIIFWGEYQELQDNGL